MNGDLQENLGLL